MALSQIEFASAFREIRPRLVQATRRLRRCSYEDAEDLVSELVLVALDRLPEYAGETDVEGIRRWLLGILHRLTQRDYRAESFQIVTEPLSEAEALPARADAYGAPEIEDLIHHLPPTHRRLVADWLDGYGQDEIARRNRLHRNTVGVRLEEAFITLRTVFPDAASIQYCFSLFAYCSRVTIYRKPTASWRPWEDQHPPEKPFRRPHPRGEEHAAFEEL